MGDASRAIAEQKFNVVEVNNKFVEIIESAI
jgi:hypothetical protein